MGAQVGLVRPIMVFHDDNGVVGGDVGLIEDEGLLLGGGALVFAFLEEVIIDCLVFIDLLLQQSDGLQQHLLLVRPLILLLLVDVQRGLQVVASLLHILRLK
jgi:hypothetical protein